MSVDGVIKNVLSIFRQKEALVFIVILVLAAALRAQETISGNFLFLIDQGRDMLEVKKIIFDLNPTLIGPYTSLQGVFQGPLWYYLLALPAFLFYGDPRAAVLLMLIISLLVILISFLWIRNTFGVATALITSLFFSLSPEAVAAATYAWNPHPMWLVILLFVICLYELVSKKNKIFFLPLFFLVGLMFHFETALAVFFFLTIFIYLFFFHRPLLFSRRLLHGLLIFTLLFLPQIVFDVRHNFIMSNSIIKVLGGHDQGLLVTGENRNYMSVVSNHITELTNNFSSSFYHDSYLKYLPFLLLVLSLCMFVIGKSKRENNFIKMLVTFTSICLGLIIFIYPFPLRYWYMTGFQVVYLLIAGILVSRLLLVKGGKYILGFIILILLFEASTRLYYLYIKPPNDGGFAKIKGKISAIDYIYNDAKSTQFGLLVFTPPVYTDAYDYLVWWHGSRKYGYIPYSNKKGSVYLLMEPDPHKPWSYKGWLETVIKSGEIIYTKELDSGLIVQKREYK